MKKLSLLFSLFLLLFVTFGQIPSHYYSNAEGKTQEELRTALYEIISNGYVMRTYAQLWTDFKTTDMRPDGYVWDMYSNCEFVFGEHQDTGTGGTAECQFYNREHSLPNSWFGGVNNVPMYTDLFHLYPTDKYVNNKRDNYPFGETNNPNSTFGNGSKLGSCSFSGYSGVVFEPIDEYKGDFARTYLYMATKYLDKNFTYDLGAVTFSYDNSTCDLTEYAVNLLLKWHRNDPVSSKEINRNNAVYTIQYNRNPYIDYPIMVEHIWGNLQNEVWYSGVGITNHENKPNITITKQNDGIFIEGAVPHSKVEIYSMIGQNVYSSVLSSNFISLSFLKQGLYIIKMEGFTTKIVWF